MNIASRKPLPGTRLDYFDARAAVDSIQPGAFDPDAFAKNRAIEDRRNEDRFHFIDWTKKAFKNVDVIPPGNGILHQINLERMSPVIYQADGVAFPDTCVGTDSHTPHVDALGV